MSDEVDITQAREELEAEIRRKYMVLASTEADPIGKCLNCGEGFDNNHQRWCDPDCQHDWKQRNDRR